MPIPSNPKLNAYLKEVADVCNNDKHLTFHTARHTFATTVTLNNGVPIESLSKMLGHKSIKITQIYAKVLDRKLSDDIGLLRKKAWVVRKYPKQILLEHLTTEKLLRLNLMPLVTWFCFNSKFRNLP